jgi:hypothetical protein
MVSDQEWHHEMPGFVRCCGYFGQAALFSLTSFSLSSPCASFVEVCLYCSKETVSPSHPRAFFVCCLITFTVFLSHVLVSSCPQQIRGVFASASTDVATILSQRTTRPSNYIDNVHISYETAFTEGAYLVLDCWYA